MFDTKSLLKNKFDLHLSLDRHPSRAIRKFEALFHVVSTADWRKSVNSQNHKHHCHSLVDRKETINTWKYKERCFYFDSIKVFIFFSYQSLHVHIPWRIWFTAASLKAFHHTIWIGIQKESHLLIALKKKLLA